MYFLKKCYDIFKEPIIPIISWLGNVLYFVSTTFIYFIFLKIINITITKKLKTGHHALTFFFFSKKAKLPRNLSKCIKKEFMGDMTCPSP